MKIYYDKQVDALYIEFKKISDGSASSKDVSDLISINYDTEGKIAGIEVLDASCFFDNIDEPVHFEQSYCKNEVEYIC